MLEVGKILKEERIKQGLSVQDIAIRTHFNVSQIEAIECGDLDYFKDDISYVKFFVQFYCKILGIDFSQFKDEFDQDMVTYTTMLTKQEVEELRQSNERMKKRVVQGKKKKKKKLRLRMDVSVISMLIIAFVMIAALGFAFGRYIFPNIMSPDTGEEPPITSGPYITDPNEGTTSSESVITVPGCSVTVREIDAKNYEFVYQGGCESINVQVSFNHRTWVDASINGTKTTDPKSNYTYVSGNEIVYVLPAENGSRLVLNMGYFKGNVFSVNEEEFELDSSIKNSTSGNTITFTVKGE